MYVFIYVCINAKACRTFVDICIYAQKGVFVV